MKPLRRDVVETSRLRKDYNAQSGRKCVNGYELARELGRGVHGKVKLAIHTESGTLFAIKILPKADRRPALGRQSAHHSHLANVRREIAILKKCCHPHIVRLQEVIDSDDSPKIYMVLEYMAGGEVVWRSADGVPALSLDQSQKVCRDVVLGLEYLHHLGIIHRDIKPANLLWTTSHTVKISDFGVSYLSTSPNSAYQLSKTAGTPAFFAPELCSSETKLRITNKIDAWALGVTLYCFLFGTLPFKADSEYELFRRIESHQYTLPWPVHPDIQHLLSSLLDKNHDSRYSLEQVKRHPYTLANLENPSDWLIQNDPRNYETIEPTEEELLSAFSRFRWIAKIRAGITGLLKRRNTISSSLEPPDIPSPQKQTLVRSRGLSNLTRHPTSFDTDTDEEDPEDGVFLDFEKKKVRKEALDREVGSLRAI
ncbi:Serine/threonine-protein kinase ssp1 [Neolecta irregularis DAH-3]|uniref:Serine/threonine-protein kinase ssp1 n=1 Tax=Neolecta irregularis (strain DAH-3) TaxID=1198029 RepID=A0A1U7LME8_NEOID|nr:Serine/threonine-protein kinase ssp1 [Neolecta irregularis DAH-3]|eukprot:OLL23763.1 Serine/threonine-protein kinase ssp1 [Neolecta irregularis DAH-3]